MSSIEDHPKRAREETIERLMIDSGAEAYMLAVSRAVESQSRTRTKAGRHVLATLVPTVAEAVERWLEEAKTKATRHGAAYPHILAATPKTCALIVVREVVDRLGGDRVPLTATAMVIGTRVEDELRFGSFEEQNPAYFKRVLAGVKGRTSDTNWHRTVVQQAMGKEGIEWASWSRNTRLHVGTLLIDLLTKSTGLVEVKTVRTGSRMRDCYTGIFPTEGVVEALSNRDERDSFLFPAWAPCVVPPKDWTGSRGGGYHFYHRLSLVKTGSVEHTRQVESAIEDGSMDTVLRAVNGAQATPWCINRRVLEVMRHCWDSDVEASPLPPRENLPLPAKTEDLEGNPEALKSWKQAAAHVYSVNAKLSGKRWATARMLQIAERYESEEAIYYPHQLDFRGRLYPVPLFLHPQGPDQARALLQFAKGMPITNSVAEGWMMVAGANLYGVDKVTFEERRQWVLDNEDDIIREGLRPFEEMMWTDAEDPWQFLAWCMEWAEYRRDPQGFVSHLPVHLDGSCNGLQHFSAMLRDQRGAEATNLCDRDAPRDIYQTVADVVLRALRGPQEKREAADLLLGAGINRKTVKRPVMVLPYGGTRLTCHRYVEDWVRTTPSCAAVLETGDVSTHASLLSSTTWDAIGEVVLASRTVMSWVQKMAKQLGKKGEGLSWVTPDGFPVWQRYASLTTRRVKTKLGDASVILLLAEPTEEIDARRQSNGASPNFVHSLDGAALRMYVCRLLDQGVTDFALVHDSFGTHAANTQASIDGIREAFVSMYEQHDVLTALLQHQQERHPDVEFDEPPPKGTMDITETRRAQYFFA